MKNNRPSEFVILKIVTNVSKSPHKVPHHGVDLTRTAVLMQQKTHFFYFYQNVIKINPGTVISRKMVRIESKKLFRCLLVSLYWQKYCNSGKTLRCRNYPQFSYLAKVIWNRKMLLTYCKNVFIHDNKTNKPPGKNNSSYEFIK